MNRLDHYLAHKLDQRTQQGNLRQLSIQKAQVDLFSNDYLGIATSGIAGGPHTGSAAAALQSGSTGSRLLSGNSAEAEELERTIATFHHAEAALLFNSGYDANIGLLSSITARDTVILSDELCHASLIDGIRLSQCSRKYKFAHNDLPELEDQLKKYTGNTGAVLVVVESVYSMDGDMAPLTQMAHLCQLYNAQLVVDEAHATGVFSRHGEGLVCALGLQDQVFARIHTFGKAIGCHGAAVVGSGLLKQYLVNFARTFIYTTALPGHTIQNIAHAYHYLASDSFTNQPLHELIAYFRQQINASGSTGWVDSHSPIQALVAGSNNTAKQYATSLQAAGLQVKPILHPTVPLGAERLRICLHTFNTRQQIDLLFSVLSTHQTNK